MTVAEHTSGLRASSDRAILKTDPRAGAADSVRAVTLYSDTPDPGWTDNLADAARSNMIMAISVAVAAVVIVGVFAVVWYVPRKR